MTYQDKNDLPRTAPQPRTTRLFTNGRNQALRLPQELEPKRRSFLNLATLPAVAENGFMAERPRLVSSAGRVKF